MALKNGLRSSLKLLASSESVILNSVSRGFHSTGMKRMSGGHGHDEPYYLHAKHMYNLDRMKHQQLKMTLGVFSAFSIGVAVPIYAVIFQQNKTKSVSRGLHSTRVTRMGGGHGHDEPFYMHTNHMYNLDRTKHQKLKVTLSVIGAFGIGCGVPIFACHFQQKKRASA